jgi:hypothetical protein
MKTLLLAGIAAITMLTAQARAADPELSADTKRMLAYGTLAVMTGSCKTTLTAAQTSLIRNGMQKAADAQKDLTQEQFTEAMKTVGAQVGQNREQVCSALTPEFIDTSLEEAAAGN